MTYHSWESIRLIETSVFRERGCGIQEYRLAEMRKEYIKKGTDIYEF